MNFAKILRTPFFRTPLVAWDSYTTADFIGNFYFRFIVITAFQILCICLHQTKILFRVKYLIVCSRRNCFTQFNYAIQLNDIHMININITWSFNTLLLGSIRFCLIILEVIYERSCSTKWAAHSPNHIVLGNSLYPISFKARFELVMSMVTEIKE